MKLFLRWQGRPGVTEDFYIFLRKNYDCWLYLF